MLKSKIIAIAMHASFFAEGLRACGKGLSEISEDFGAVDLVAEIAVHAEYLEELAELATSVPGIEYPGVIDYEVSDFFGQWFATQTMANGHVPSFNTCREWLKAETLQFFSQGASKEEAEKLEAAFAAEGKSAIAVGDEYMGQLTRVQIESIQDADGYIRVVVPFTLSELIGSSDYEGLNEMAETKLLVEGFLADIDYKVVGASGEDVLVEVRAQVEFSD